MTMSCHVVMLPQAHVAAVVVAWQSWDGPILMADLEAGMYGGNDTFGIQNSPIDNEFNT